MASMVAALGTSGSNGRAFSRAMRTNRRRKASDTVKPMAARTVAASSLIASSIRARTTVFAIRSLLTSPEILSYIVAQLISLSSMHGVLCHQWWFLTRAVRGQRVSLFTSDAVGNEPWRCEQALSGRWPSLHKHHRLRWRCAPAGTAPQGCGIRSTPSHTPLIAENNNQGMLASRLVLPPIRLGPLPRTPASGGKHGCASLPLPGSGSPRRPGLPPRQASARSQARGGSTCSSPSACCASSLQGIARDGWGALWRQGQCPPLRCGWRRLGTSRGVTPALDAPTQGLASVLVDRCSAPAPPWGCAVLPVCGHLQQALRVQAGHARAWWSWRGLAHTLGVRHLQ